MCCSSSLQDIRTQPTKCVDGSLLASMVASMVVKKIPQPVGCPCIVLHHSPHIPHAGGCIDHAVLVVNILTAK